MYSELTRFELSFAQANQPYSTWQHSLYAMHKLRSPNVASKDDRYNLIIGKTMSTQENPSSSVTPPIPGMSIFERIESYPFSTDPEFQSGLSAILSSNSTQEPEFLTLRARCFYFARKHHVTIDFESYKRWRSDQNLPTVTANREAITETQTNGIAQEIETADLNSVQEPNELAAPYPSSFSRIVDLITKGEPIPGIKDIPDTLLVGQESSPTTAKRKKPWEKDRAVDELQTTTLEGQG